MPILFSQFVPRASSRSRKDLRLAKIEEEGGAEVDAEARAPGCEMGSGTGTDGAAACLIRSSATPGAGDVIRVTSMAGILAGVGFLTLASAGASASSGLGSVAPD